MYSVLLHICLDARRGHLSHYRYESPCSCWELNLTYMLVQMLKEARRADPTSLLPGIIVNRQFCAI